jgi:hypothetical protein
VDHQQRRQWAEHGANRVHRAVQAEGDAAVLVAHAGGQQRVTRRRAHALADAVDEAADHGQRPDE